MNRKILIIKEVREMKNMTQDEVVDKSGIKKRSYVDYENGKSDITLSKLQKIAIALNVEITDLIVNSKRDVLKGGSAALVGGTIENDILALRQGQAFLKKQNEEILDRLNRITLVEGIERAKVKIKAAKEEKADR